jgi:hypothetical protein
MPPNNPFFQTGDPLKIESSHLRDSDPRWQVLFKDEYRLDIENRTVTVGLKPGEALRINEGGEWNEKYAGENFAIEELNIKGANGEVNLKGDRVYKSFVPVWRPFYAFGPPTTLLTLTYK